MKINKKQLLDALETVKPGLANREQIEQSTSFAFLGNRVVTYNDEISISAPVTGMEITGAIQADNLYKFLGKIKKEEIELEVKGNEIVITSGKSKAGLTLQSEIKLPLNEDIAEKSDWNILPENFLQGVKFVVSACGKDMNRPVLTCVHVSQKGFVEACDNFRIAKYTLGGEMPLDTFLMPSTSVLTMHKLQPTQISEGKGWVHFKTEEGVVFSCRVFEDAYPDTKAFFNIQGEKVTFPKTIEEVLDMAGVFAKRDNVMDETVNITISDKRLKVSSKSETGWFEEEVNMAYEGENLSFDVTPHLLKQILSETLACVVGKSKLEFEGESWAYITMLRENL